MALRCALIGLPGCGKTTIFNAITAAKVPQYGATEVNRAVVNVPDKRIDRLVEMYHPRKTINATLDVIDTPGIRTDAAGKSRLLGSIKDVEALLHVVRCFEDDTVPFGDGTINPQRDVETVDLELLSADIITLDNKLNRLEKRVKAGDKDAVRETASCQKIRSAIEQGVPARKQGLTHQELAAIYECNLVSLKPVLYIANIKTPADNDNRHVQSLKQIAASEATDVVTICGKDEADIAELEPADRAVFLQELGLEESSMERLLYAAYSKLGLLSFFTVGEDEVRAWTCRQGDKAPIAAGKIHKDMEAGFIRMEVFTYDDLIAYGSEAAVAKAGKHRVEGKDYEVKDGDIVMVLFNTNK